MMREPPLGLKQRTFLPFLETEKACELSITSLYKELIFVKISSNNKIMCIL
jgi:hypothetical protein